MNISEVSGSATSIKRQHDQATYRLYLWLLLLAFFLNTNITEAQTSVESAKKTIETANILYNQASYDTAVHLYEQVLAAGYESDWLYYNLGNAYYKLRDLPSAILYYEKASKLNPNDEDIKKNLEIANSQIIDKIEPLPQLFLKNWWNAFYTMVNADTWAWISMSFFAILLVMLFLFLTTSHGLKKFSFFMGLLSLLFTLAAFGLASQKYYYTQQTNEAIIFTPTITVKSSPGATSVDLFVLHAGTKVRLLDKTVGWNKIRIANGSVGWLPDESMKGI